MMRLKLRITLAGVLVSAAAFSGSAAAAPIEPLQPMAFLAGHCWKGDFPGGKETDEHCFAWLYDGKALRDTHTVRAPGRPDYIGETTYYWDSAAKRVEFVYIENLGGISRGNMQSMPEALIFPPTQYVADGQAMTYRVRWTRLSDTSYEAWSEMQGKDGWTTMFKLTMKRSS
ncbi:MAG TPA: hypothetical protein VHT22_00660 [Casimicrobiaceae bacterium]|jgi:hypothetical protein|nr:hypothetical protein [Casimicrobiaceae bacterium]